jgi:hypothetical protein
MTATTIRPRPGWVPPEDLDVLEPTDKLLGLRDARQRAAEAFKRARAQVGELLEQRDELERRVLDGEAKADRKLAELNIRIALAPKQVAIAADELAAATIDWARYVEDAAEDVRLDAKAAEAEFNKANRRVLQRHLYRGTKEIPGVREELQQAVAKRQPLRDRQEAAGRLKSNARIQVRRLLGVRGNARLGPAEIGDARREFVQRACAEAAEVVGR